MGGWEEERERERERERKRERERERGRNAHTHKDFAQRPRVSETALMGHYNTYIHKKMLMYMYIIGRCTD